MTQLILPSLMPQTQSELDQDIKKLKNKVKTLHLDIVDGKFAKNKTFQFPFKLSPPFRYQAHLMVENPESWIDRHGNKVDLIIFHPEVFKDDKKEKINWLIKKIKNKKKKVGLALRPETKIKPIKSFIKKIDCLLILTVHPGFYGGKFLPAQLRKIKKIKKLNKKIKIIVDGGISPKTIKKAKKAGADFFVSGSYTTKASHPQERLKTLMKAIN